LIDNSEYPSEVVSQSINSIVEVCAQGASDCTGYLDLEAELVPTYIASIPNDPNLTGNGSGYAISKTSAGLGIVAIGTEGSSTVAVGQEFTPDLLSGLVSWYDFSDESTLTIDSSGGTDTISTVVSKHNQSNTLSQGTKSNQPVQITSSRSEKTAVSFEGNGQYLISSLNTSNFFGVADSEDGAVVIAFDPDETPIQDQYVFQFQRDSGRSFLSLTSQSWLNGSSVIPNAQDAGVFFRRNGAWLSYRLQDALAPGEAFVITASFDDAVPLTQVYLGGAEVYSVNTGTSYDGGSGNHPLVVGNTGEATEQYYGDIYEILIFDRALSSDEVETLTTYLTYTHNLE
jgi:hypothetical protein